MVTDKEIISKIFNSESGVSLIITFFIMIIILSVVFSVSGLLYSEIKVIRNVGNSVMSFYAANSGIEKILFYDDQVLPVSVSTDSSGNQTTAVGLRGLCSMYPYNYSYNSLITNTQWTNPLSCPDNSSVIGLDKVVYCAIDDSTNGGMPLSLSSDHNGCDPSVCDDCQIAFTGLLDNGATYSTVAKVFPSSNTLSTTQTSNFEITSIGSFGGGGETCSSNSDCPSGIVCNSNHQCQVGGASRQIKISISAIKAKDVIQIAGDCASPKSTGQGESVNIQANVSIGIPGNDTIGSVATAIYDANGNYYDIYGNIAPVSACTTDSDCNVNDSVAGKDISGEVCAAGLCSLPLTNTTSNFASSVWSLSPEWTTDLVQKYFVSLTATDTLCTACSTTGPDCTYCCGGVCSTTACSAPSCSDNVKTIGQVPPCGF